MAGGIEIVSSRNFCNKVTCWPAAPSTLRKFSPACGPHEEAQTSELLGTLQYFPIIWPVARLAGLLKRDYKLKGTTLAATDVTIAAMAIYHQLTLMTDNLKHYPMKELNLYPLPKT